MRSPGKLLNLLAALPVAAALTLVPAMAEKADKLPPPAADAEPTKSIAALETDEAKLSGPVGDKTFAEDVCAIMAKEAKRRGLPPNFLARLIWRESTFDPDAVSPKGAQGIAQFMPYTADERGLEDPFAPHEALSHSAHLLADLRQSLGNLGLAAAAYNAGEQAVADWLKGNRSLPYETQDYVAFITGQPVENWMERASDHPIPAIGGDVANFTEDCVKLVKRQMAPHSSGAKATGGGGGARGPWKPWGVVLSGGFNERRALDAFNRIKKRYPGILSGKQPMVARKKNASRGRSRLVSIMVGHDQRGTADKMCDALQAQGAACIVLKNTK